MSRVKDELLNQEVEEKHETDPVYDEQGIHAKMIMILRDIGHIGKDQNNQQQGFKFRGIDQVYNALHRLFAEHGVYCTSEVLEKHREERTTSRGGILAFTTLRMKYTFHADDGSSVSTVVEGEGMDSGDKSSNKAMAAAHKYALLQAFLIPTDEVKDPDAESHELGIDVETVKRVVADTLACLESDDSLGIREIWDELTHDEQQNIWREFNTKQKGKIRALLQQAATSETNG